MSSTQRPTRRRSARHAFDEDEAGPVKKAKTDGAGAGGASAKQNGRSNGAAAKAAKAAKAAYDENEDGFTFSRTRSKKKQQQQPTTTTASASSDPAPAENAAPVKPKPSRRKKDLVPESAPAPAPSEDGVSPKRRRSARLSGDKDQVATPAPEKQLKRAKKTADQAPSNEQDRAVSVDPAGDGGQLVVEKKRDATKIALPFADTPIIRRNKEMRKGSGKDGHRRSSTGMRGRRASSLIDSGTSNGGHASVTSGHVNAVDKGVLESAEADFLDGTAVPHAEVETQDFYKHIEQSLPEPRRMKQLLTWCGSRALPEKPSGGNPDTNAILAARAIQQEILDDFANKSEMTDWFSRDESGDAVLVKKPNPRNVQNAAKLLELEAEVQRLQEEKRSWEALINSSSPEQPPATAGAERYPKASQSTTSIDPLLLDDSSQAAILATLNSASKTLPSESPEDQRPSASAPNVTTDALEARLRHITTSLEPTIDLFADGVHRIAQYRLAAERVADRILGVAAERLEKREQEIKERSGTENIGTGDVLRALSGVLNEQR
ncbi:hypothetical protein H2201_004205 [Coniosporium apollinis]|uniref:Kinetochore protein Mis13/DSN1 n=2 Tax=Coniosporium TaxID=2810619 RepID=A0ABQ9NXG0_9PEZI|nr:hypothetical protein H2199_007261 [Cladosporium sp. JES 115]KAJ9665721.1 hypothetical protein H2201_004205 [Coniosporium apollinis]